MNFRSGTLIIIFGLIFLKSYTQDRIPSRQGQVMQSRNEYIREFHDSISSPDRRLVNGEIYFPHQTNARNHPFYKTEAWINGTATIRDHQYNNLLLKYDIFLDQPLLLYIDGGAQTIALNKEFVEAFTLEEDLFVYLDPEGKSEDNKREGGFYQQLYKGDLILYVRWNKIRIKNEGLRPDEFQQDISYLLLDKGEYKIIKNDRSLKSILNSHKKEIRKYMQQNNIHVAFSSPYQIATVIGYFENELMR
jgi:hypothetical protein